MALDSKLAVKNLIVPLPVKPLLFKEISGGYGDYQKFFTGIEESLNLGLKISFNRVLLKGFVGDLNSQVKIIENYGARLKLYTLMWTPENHEYYQKFFFRLETCH